jgi:hypothetical protein
MPTGSTPKFGNCTRRGVTEQHFDQKPGSNWEKVNRNVKWGRTYKIHENRSRREAGAAHQNSVIGLGRDRLNEISIKRLVATGRRRVAMSNGVAHIKFMRTEAAARQGQHTEIRRSGLDGTDGTKFRSKAW